MPLCVRKALPPLLLFMGDCSGSTWVQSLSRAMLIAHDVPFLEKRYEDIKEVRTEVLGNKGPAWKTFRNRLRKAERMGAHYVSKFNTDDLRSRVSGAITKGGKYLTTVVAGKNAKNKNFHRLGPGHRAVSFNMEDSR